jgi:4-hydroxybenzoate polyprenyltransferase/phosphoserine phosphatase
MLATHEDGTLPATKSTPLCVDLDGTLINGDLLHEASVALLRHDPLRAALLPVWLLRGKAYLKERLAEHVTLDAAALPYRTEVVEYLRREAENGRRIVLATASHARFAKAVAAHLGFFSEVIATENGRNLKGEEKRAELTRRFGEGGYDYVGDSKADLPVWEGAREALVVSPSKKLLEQAERRRPAAKVFQTEKRSKLKAAAKLMRPHQWAKNVLLFVPLILAHQWFDLGRILSVLLAFVSFSLSASAVYVLNDLLDLEADRKHPTKRNRPLAAGRLSIPHGIALFGALLTAGITIPLCFLSWTFVGMLAGYLVLTTAYSVHLKREPILDVFVLAGLYTHRILSGGIAANVLVSGWLLAFAVFFFLSLALAKRYAELARASTEDRSTLDRRGYIVEDLGLIQALGPTTGYMAVLTFCLYINASDILGLYRTPTLLWGICLVLFYWITRVWFLARRRLLHEDPVIFATRDRVSYLCGGVVVAFLILAI